MPRCVPRIVIVTALAIAIAFVGGCGMLKPDGSSVSLDQARAAAALYVEQTPGIADIAKPWLRNPAIKVSVQWGTVPDVYDGQSYSPPIGKAWVVLYDNPEGAGADPQAIKVLVDGKGQVRNAYTMRVIKRGDVSN